MDSGAIKDLSEIGENESGIIPTNNDCGIEGWGGIEQKL